VKRLLLVALLLVVVAGVTVVVWTRVVGGCEGVHVTVFLDPDISDSRTREVRAEIATFASDIAYFDRASS